MILILLIFYNCWGKLKKHDLYLIVYYIDETLKKHDEFVGNSGKK